MVHLEIIVRIEWLTELAFLMKMWVFWIHTLGLLSMGAYICIVLGRAT
jgi:hypothetical protein